MTGLGIYFEEMDPHFKSSKLFLVPDFLPQVEIS